MEYGIYLAIAVFCLAVGFVGGVLYGRSNSNDVERVVSNVKAEYSRATKKAADLKAKAESQGIKL